MTALRICVGSTEPPDVIEFVQRRTPGIVLVRSLPALYRFLDERTRSGPTPDASQLDLIGPATGQGLLQLGGSVIDGAVLPVLELFTRMADERVLPRLGIQELRLLGSRTAGEVAGQDTMRRLAQILRVRVVGATRLLFAIHFDPDGFDPAFDGLLADDGAAPHPHSVEPELDGERAAPFAHDALLATAASDLRAVAWPRFVVPPTFDVVALSGLLRLGEGRLMPGLLALPRCELLVPARRPPGATPSFHVIEILFNWTLVRIRDHANPGGVIYPVVSPARFVRMFIALPQLHR